MNDFFVIFEIKESDIKNDKSISFNNEIKYFICIFNYSFIILIQKCKVLKQLMLTSMLIIFIIISIVSKTVVIIFL